jgi:hypothetical protein
VTLWRIALDFAVVFLLVLLLCGCAPLPVIPPEVRTTTVLVPTPIAAPCFTEAERPVLAPDTVVDPATATTEQLAAAELANAEALRDYSRAVDALFIKCQKGTP